MSNATVDSLFMNLKQIEQLRKQAEAEYNQYQEALQKVNNTLQKISEVASKANIPLQNSAIGSENIGKSHVSPPTTLKKRPGQKPFEEVTAEVTPVVKKTRGRPKAAVSQNTTSTEGTKKRRGRPPKNSVDNASKPAVQRNFENNKSLRETCWEVLSRDGSYFRKFFNDYPEGAKGLKVSEVKEIIVKEGRWTSSSADIGVQVQNALHNLRNKELKLERNEEDRRYYIIDGKNLD
jgi:hypothetical protein